MKISILHNILFESKSTKTHEKNARCGELGECRVTLGVIPVSLPELPMMHVLIVTHLFSVVEMEIVALFLS